MNEEIKQPSEEEIVRWLDGELEGEELARLERLANQDAGLASLREQSRWFGEVVGDVPSAKREVQDPEAFHDALNAELDAFDQSANVRSEAKGNNVILLRDWRVAGGWLAAAAALVVAMLAIFQQEEEKGMPLATAIFDPTPLIATYTPHVDISADAYYDDEAEVVVIVLDGVRPVEDDVVIAGYFSGPSSPVTPGAVMAEQRIFPATGRWFDMTLAGNY